MGIVKFRRRRLLTGSIFLLVVACCCMSPPPSSSLSSCASWVVQGTIKPYADNVAVFEPTLLIEGGIFRVWYSRAVFTGTVICDIYYIESSDAGVSWSSPVLCASSLARSYVYKHPTDGYYYLMGAHYGVGSTNVTYFQCYRSSTGDAGSWTLFADNLLPCVSGWDDFEAGNIWFQWAGSEWQILYEASGSPGVWAVGYASGNALDNLTKSGDNPVYSGSAGDIKYSRGTYYLHNNESGGKSIVRRSSSSLTGPWTIVCNELNPYGAYSSYYLADPSLCEYNGKVYMMYEGMASAEVWPLEFSLELAVFDGSLENLFGYYGCFNGILRGSIK